MAEGLELFAQCIVYAGIAYVLVAFLTRDDDFNGYV